MARDHWTIKELLKVSTEYFQGKDIDHPRLSAEVLLAHLLHIDRIQLYLDPDRPLQEEEVAGYRMLVKRRAGREPLQHIRGTQEFWSIDFLVGPDVLIPRPESELLVEQTVELLGQLGPTASGTSILDLGTGSGALIISLGLEIPDAFLCATDLSGKALAVAVENARRHGLDKRIRFVQGDLFGPFKPHFDSFEFIVSNPPYVPSEVLPTLMPEIGFEPRMALDGGTKGMRWIEAIIPGAADFLVPGGWLLVEMDPAQIQGALELIERTGRYGRAKAVKDYSRRNRVVTAQKWSGRVSDTPRSSS
jgi:release factor glutamine methyltransferase